MKKAKAQRQKTHRHNNTKVKDTKRQNYIETHIKKTHTRDKMQETREETRDKRQETSNKRQQTRDKRGTNERQMRDK